MTQGRLAGKVAIVTGAAPRGPGVGNGSAVAILFAREGAKVVLVNRSASRAQELQHTIQQEGGECAVCIADVTREHDVARMVDFATEHYGRLDILHNNVGHAGAARMAEMTEGFVAYSTAKAGVGGLTRALAAELAGDGIRVNCIVIGMVDTPIVANLGEEVREKRRLAVPLQTTGTGWDVGWAAVYLASEESRWITAIELPIDAGQMRILDRPR